MVTLVSIKLTGESNIIDDNPTMKQADEMSLQFIRDPNIISTFFSLNFSNVLISGLLLVQIPGLFAARCTDCCESFSPL